jgi:hypothetical protein
MHKKKPLLYGMCNEVAFVITFRQNENNLISSHIGHNSKRDIYMFFLGTFFWTNHLSQFKSTNKLFKLEGFKFMHFKIKLNANVIQGKGTFLFVCFVL